jgi:hypothetical protein
VVNDPLDNARRDALLRYAVESDPGLLRRLRKLLHDVREPQRAATILGAIAAEADAICRETGA